MNIDRLQMYPVEFHKHYTDNHCSCFLLLLSLRCLSCSHCLFHSIHDSLFFVSLIVFDQHDVWLWKELSSSLWLCKSFRLFLSSLTINSGHNATVHYINELTQDIFSFGFTERAQLQTHSLLVLLFTSSELHSELRRKNTYKSNVDTKRKVTRTLKIIIITTSG